MKRILKNMAVYTVAVAMIVGLSTMIHAEDIFFSDVPANYWGYSTIMRMTNTGMFKGTSEPVNGVGTFAPEKTMSRAEFITAVLRAVYPEAAASITNSQGQWWRGYYNLALNCGLLYSNELNNGAMDLPMSRQEMAMVLVRAMANKGEVPLKLISPLQIADYASIDVHYKEYVIRCFSMGLICGVDANGTFAPEKSLTRAEAATVLCRLVFANDRVVVSFLDDGLNGGNETTEGGLLKPGQSEESSKPSGINRPIIDKDDDSDDDNNDDREDSKQGNSQDNENSDDKNQEAEPDITWEEFMEMNEWEQQQFMNSFESQEAFDEWLENNQNSPNVDNKLPWEDGGKQPEDYTLEEYAALTEEQRYAFEAYFENKEAFEAWLEKNQKKPDLEEDDLLGGKTLDEFTLEDYAALDIVDAAAFREQYFDSEEEFWAWLESKTELPDLDE